MSNNKQDQIEYDKWWNNFQSLSVEEPGSNYRINMVLDELRRLDVKKIADIGCGAGQLIKKIKHVFPNLSSTGFDVSPLIIGKNKERIKNASFYTINLNDESDIGEKFDMVICCEVIEHVKNWKKAVSTLSNLVQSNGYIIITTQAGKIYTHHKTLGHFKHFKLEEIEKELKKNGITTIKSFYSGWPFMNFKNYLINIFFRSIENSSFNSKKQNFFNKITFRVFKLLYKNSSQKMGPQIFNLGKKCDI